MLKSKVKSLESRINSISKSKRNGIFFVVIENGEYKVCAAGQDTLLFQGNESDFHKLTASYGEDSVFIIDDIPDTRKGETNLFDWIL
jgi:sulfur relay (sulfurtransferase) DsrF/TusC family protein